MSLENLSLGFPDTNQSAQLDSAVVELFTWKTRVSEFDPAAGTNSPVFRVTLKTEVLSPPKHHAPLAHLCLCHLHIYNKLHI